MKSAVYTFLLFAWSLSAFSQTLPPGIVLKDINGNLIHLDSVVMQHTSTFFFFWALWASKERSPLYNLRDISESWKNNYNTEIVAVSEDDSRNTTKIKPFANGIELNFPVLLDPNGDMKRKLNFQFVPTCIIVNQKREIVYRKTGYLQGDEVGWEEELKKVKLQEGK